mgnify:CR=1 FL=1
MNWLHCRQSSLITAIDSGGTPTNTLKINAIARGLGLDIAKKAAPEDTIARIRSAIDRVDTAPATETPATETPATETPAPVPVVKVESTSCQGPSCQSTSNPPANSAIL